MRPIIIDTNFWLLPFERRVNLLEQLQRLLEPESFELIVPSAVANELKTMAGGNPAAKNTRAARAALGVIERYEKEGRARAVERDGPADGIIIGLALEMKAMVATNDRPLRLRLKDKKVRVILLRDEHILDWA
ncbi:MAG: hypothetical protein KGH63_00870 [Candidatus Micrarchaeota archaeon]|nr:hypothetical protein [Candidatus Micrarchaeota archaeon]